MRTVLLLILFFTGFLGFSQNNIIYKETAEGASIFTTYVTKQTTTTYGIIPTKCMHFNGGQSAKFELRDTDEMNNSGTRAEITFPTITNLTRWYSFAIYFPALDYLKDTDDEVINQWHQGGGLTPALCIRTMNDSMYLRVIEDPGGDDEWINLGFIRKNVWRTFVMHIVHSSTTSGVVEIWIDGDKILNRTGKKTMYPVTGSVTNPNWKLGIYKSGWNDASTTDTDRRVILFDDIRYGDENATFLDMVPIKHNY
jgi:hypothetical protein